MSARVDTLQKRVPWSCRVLPAAITAQLERLQEREEVRFGTAAGVLVDAAEVSLRNQIKTRCTTNRLNTLVCSWPSRSSPAAALRVSDMHVVMSLTSLRCSDTDSAASCRWACLYGRCGGACRRVCSRAASRRQTTRG